jgi:hypothetical protein
MLKFVDFNQVPVLDQIIVSTDGETAQVLRERTWISGRFERNIGIDDATSGDGRENIHVLGRKGEQLVVVVNLDGTGGHGTQGRLQDQDAAALRAKGFNVHPGNLVEWCVLADAPELLMGW